MGSGKASVDQLLAVLGDQGGGSVPHHNSSQRWEWIFVKLLPCACLHQLLCMYKFKYLIDLIN